MAALILKGVSKAFGPKDILCSVDLEVPSGSLVAVLGASGSGKTTLLRLVAGFERCDAGTIQIADRLVAGPGLHVPPERRAVGYVAQEGALFPHLSVADNIVFGLPRQQRRARHRVAELLDMVGLPADFASRPAPSAFGRRTAACRPGPGPGAGPHAGAAGRALLGTRYGAPGRNPAGGRPRPDDVRRHRAFW